VLAVVTKDMAALVSVVEKCALHLNGSDNTPFGKRLAIHVKYTISKLMK
jgi:hypothetical protein